MSDPRIIVALDFASADEALGFVNRISPAQCRLKVGAELFTVGGPALVGALAERGFDVFLDLKFHDIPNTVAQACAAAAKMRVWMVNVHTLGGRRMLRAAREAIDASSHRPLLIGVTMLTSQSEQDIAELGFARKPQDHVSTLAAIAHQSLLDGVVCSAREAAALRKKFGKSFILVTPGIRLGPVEQDDQVRTMSPTEAVANGADYLVIGRLITQALEPRRALESINLELGSV